MLGRGEESVDAGLYNVGDLLVGSLGEGGLYTAVKGAVGDASGVHVGARRGEQVEAGGEEFGREPLLDVRHLCALAVV